MHWHKKKLVWAVVALVVVGAAVFVIPRLLQTDLKTALARQLQVDRDFLYVNLPPAKGRLPGFTFMVAGSVLPLEYVDRTDPALQVGPEFSVDWSQATGSKATGMTNAGTLGSLFTNSRDVKVEARATRCRILEMRLDDLKKRVLASTTVLDQSAKGSQIFVVIRAFEGQLEVRLTRTGQASAEVWADATKAAEDVSQSSASGEAKVTVQSKSDDAIVLAWNEPVVFAYEVQRATLFASHMSMVPNEVRLTPVGEPELQSLLADVPPAATRPTTEPAARSASAAEWELATAAMGFYPRVQYLQQSWNAGCADAVERALTDYRPSQAHRLRATKTAPIGSPSLLDFARTTASAAKGRGSTCVVFYYIGHAITRADGEVLLLQGEVSTEDLKDKTRTRRNGLLPLRELYDALATGGVPFTLLIDGCMGNDQFQSFVQDLGFQYDPARPTLYYVGSAPVVFGEMSQLADRMRRFADDQPHLKGPNPIIFAAKPGTVAMVRENPEWVGGSPMAPLALKTIQAVRRNAANPDPPALPSLVGSLADFRYTGQIALDGTISWSDFDAFNGVARRIRVTHGAEPTSPAAGAVVAIHKPGVGQVKDFLCLADGQFLIIANQWDLCRWKVGDRSATVIEKDLHFPSIAADRSGATFLHVADDHELLPVTGNVLGPAIRDQLWVAAMGAGYEGNSVIVVAGPSPVDAVEDVLRLENGRFSTVDRIVTASVIDVAEPQKDVFCYTQEDHSEILRRQGGVSGELCRGLASPKLLASVGSVLYCVNEAGSTLYQIAMDGRVQRADLLAIEPAIRMERYPVTRGFRAGPDKSLLLASGETILQIDPLRLAWAPFMPARK